MVFRAKTPIGLQVTGHSWGKTSRGELTKENVHKSPTVLCSLDAQLLWMVTHAILLSGRSCYFVVSCGC